MHRKQIGFVGFGLVLALVGCGEGRAADPHTADQWDRSIADGGAPIEDETGAASSALSCIGSTGYAGFCAYCVPSYSWRAVQSAVARCVANGCASACSVPSLSGPDCTYYPDLRAVRCTSYCSSECATVGGDSGEPGPGGVGSGAWGGSGGGGGSSGPGGVTW